MFWYFGGILKLRVSLSGFGSQAFSAWEEKLMKSDEISRFLGT
jgi:hypothetical protein